MRSSRERFDELERVQLCTRFLVSCRAEALAGGEEALAELFVGRLNTFLSDIGETYDVALHSCGVWAIERDQTANSMIALLRRRENDDPSADLVEYELSSYCLKRGVFPFPLPFQETIPDDDPLLVLHRKVASLLADWPEITRELDYEFYEERRARQLSALIKDAQARRSALFVDPQRHS